jgi:putative iron-dependent peroxidase
LHLRELVSPADALARLRSIKVDPRVVVGIGAPLLPSMKGLSVFPALSGVGVAIPSTQGALWLAIGGQDAGETLHNAREWLADFEAVLRLDEDVCGFVHAGGRDLSGFEDGTENPKGEAAVQAAISTDIEHGLVGSSFVGVQKWVHNLKELQAHSSAEQSEWIGRDLQSNEEMPDAPISAHVKRAAQESFEPPAFVLRRSMPFGDLNEHGLYFVAYGATLRPFETILRRMVGLEDGIVDSLFKFTRPVTGGYYWCPPTDGDRYALP